MLKHRNGVLMERFRSPNKNRKRECSSSSSASSKIRSCRLDKQAILVAKNRSGTLIPICGTTPLRSFTNSPNVISQCGKSSRPVSARKLAATLWELNEIPSPKRSETNFHQIKQKKNGVKKEKSGLEFRGHLLDPSHSPVISEKMDRPEMGCHHRAPLISERLRLVDQNDAIFDSISQSSFLDVEDRAAISNGSMNGGATKNRLKDISNALTTSKELLKIISRLWVRADQSSSRLSVISALHVELERARLQVNHLIRESPEKRDEVTYLKTCISEEKALWRSEKHEAIEAAVRAVSDELVSERKLRRRLESLNKKLGNELVEIKSSFVETVKELQNEKRTREITEQMCDELVRNVDGEDKIRTDSVMVHANGDRLKYLKRNRTEAKNSAIGKLKKQLEVFLGAKRDKDDDKPSNRIFRRTPPLQRSVSDGLDSGTRSATHRNEGDGSKQPRRRSHFDETLRYKLVKSLKSRRLSSSNHNAGIEITGSKSRPILNRK